MDTDEALLDCASINEATARALNVEPWDVLRIYLPSQQPAHLTSCIGQVIVRPSENCGEGSSGKGKESKPEIFIHPLMYEFLCTSFTTVSEYGAGVSSEENLAVVSVTPLPLPGAILNDEILGQRLPWAARRVESIRELPPGSSISVALLYVDDELHTFCVQSDNYHATLQSILSFFLEERLLMKGTTTLLSTLEGMAIATVDEIHDCCTEEKSNGDSTDDIVYRLGNADNYNLSILHDEVTSSRETDTNQHISSAMVTWQSDCPGYENLVRTLVQMASLKGSAAPSGILLTGSPQVGKTHLASCVAYQLVTASNPAAVHWVSVQDLIMQASWASESDLLDILRPPSRTSRDHLQVLVIDDLHIFATQESTLQEDSISINLDPEMLVVRNSVLQIIDELSSLNMNGADSAVAILGIAQSTSNIPVEFVRSGRLEKEICMLPPTQSQRETILNKIIPTLTVGEARDELTARKWAEALSPVTVGCVAGDLCRVLAAAWTRATARGWIPGEDINCPDLRWEDLQNAAQTYVPIQLENVDVCKPQSFLSLDRDGCEESLLDPNDWARIHELSWKTFGGYPMVKKRLLRTVVGPWRRFLKSIDLEQNETTAPLGLSPPPGVLFHGASGNGKSFAASCLASSLSLPMIKVKAADVMDKWLGGSEAIIRSLFTRARSAAPCILFFDEIDAIATNRAGGDEGGAEVMSRLLSTLLNEMDGISSDKRKHNVLVIACTNRLEDLDAALLRPGRLEEHIHLENPDAPDITAMLQLHLSKVPLSNGISLDELAQELARRHATGADVEGICHEACLGAVHRTNSSDVVLMQEDIDHALRSSRL